MKIKRFSKVDREASEREFLRGRSEKNHKIASLASIPASMAGFYGTAGTLWYLNGNRPVSMRRGVLLNGASILSGVATGLGSAGAIKLGLDRRDYLKVKRLTNEELKKENDKLKKKDSKTK